MSLRKHQKFQGVLTDEELNYLEDGLVLLREDKEKVLISKQKNQISELILKLYKFWEI